MGGITGNIRSRTTSSVNGSKTLQSIIAGDSGSGAGSFLRMAKWAKKNNMPIFSMNYNMQFGAVAGRWRLGY
jgi:hypothetical protein